MSALWNSVQLVHRVRLSRQGQDETEACDWRVDGKSAALHDDFEGRSTVAYDAGGFRDWGEQLIVIRTAGFEPERLLGAGDQVAHAVVAVSIYGALAGWQTIDHKRSSPATSTLRTGVGLGFAACEVDQAVDCATQRRICVRAGNGRERYRKRVW